MRLAAASPTPRPLASFYGYYRTNSGAGVDLVIDTGKGDLLAVEIKRSTAPSVAKGFYRACEDLQPTKRYVIHAGNDSFPLEKGIEALPVETFLHLMRG